MANDLVIGDDLTCFDKYGYIKTFTAMAGKDDSLALRELSMLKSYFKNKCSTSYFDISDTDFKKFYKQTTAHLMVDQRFNKVHIQVNYKKKPYSDLLDDIDILLSNNSFQPVTVKDYYLIDPFTPEFAAANDSLLNLLITDTNDINTANFWLNNLGYEVDKNKALVGLVDENAVFKFKLALSLNVPYFSVNNPIYYLDYKTFYYIGFCSLTKDSKCFIRK